ncbi:acyltransferase family protein [Pokkaliibacter sp. CJK22405]|uniref:acyltransferase family protein n=1 Tax=Pokkaliibacter sp. CJK22405 TaxID=3384615 RepID=UPI0039855660
MGQRIIEFDYLRGLAIVYIVLGHSIANSGNGFPELLENLIRGGTGVFVFVSGFFFHRVFYPRFQYQNFMSKKFVNVAIPFFVVSLIGLVIQSVDLAWLHDKTASEIMQANWATVQNGFVLFPHWYIPFIMLTFALSPLHMAYIRLSAGWQLGLFLLSCAISIVLQRPEENINVLHSVIYFSPFYLLGILYSAQQQSFEQHAGTIRLLCWLAVIIGALMQTYVDHHLGNYHKDFFVWKGLDWQFVQKIGISLLLLDFCRWMIGKPGAGHLQHLANISFPIFFLHPIIAVITGSAIWYCSTYLGLTIPRTMGWGLFFTLAFYLLFMYGTVLMVHGVKAMLGERSRWVMGW